MTGLQVWRGLIVTVITVVVAVSSMIGLAILAVLIGAGP